MKRLEDEADLPVPKQRQLPVLEPFHRHAVQAVLTPAGRVQGAHDVQGRGLARAGRAGNGHQLATADPEIDALERVHPAFPGRIAPAEPLESHERLPHARLFDGGSGVISSWCRKPAKQLRFPVVKARIALLGVVVGAGLVVGAVAWRLRATPATAPPAAAASAATPPSASAEAPDAAPLLPRAPR